MNWSELINSIFQVCIIPLLGILTTFFVQFLNAKKNEISQNLSNKISEEDLAMFNKYLNMVETTVADCVIATNQTYVESLKAQGKFDADAQKEAFQKTLDAVLAILSDDAKDYISSIFGDVNTYLTNLIESQVNKNK